MTAEGSELQVILDAVARLGKEVEAVENFPVAGGQKINLILEARR